MGILLARLSRSNSPPTLPISWRTKEQSSQSRAHGKRTKNQAGTNTQDAPQNWHLSPGRIRQLWCLSRVDIPSGSNLPYPEGLDPKQRTGSWSLVTLPEDIAHHICAANTRQYHTKLKIHPLLKTHSHPIYWVISRVARGKWSVRRIPSRREHSRVTATRDNLYAANLNWTQPY